MLKKMLRVTNGLAKASSQRSEIAAAAIVTIIIMMLILPLPTLLVDALIALNICASSLLLVIALYLKNPLSFSGFPPVLLLTTVFRLGIEISVTRLILLDADAGEIVETFGEFVVGGNLVVGLIVFLIVTVVQFIVITKGAERVAEVSARFALDAVPGKQMAIDSDMRAGLIDQNQARTLRSELARESQMHGAMDGAMKFVKGDAIAGLIVVFVNLIGGISIGMLQRGLPAGEALSQYSVLTIGDGLIAQIPALLIALTAGIMITRVAQDENCATRQTVGSEIAGQLLGQPHAWLVASGIMVAFAAIPGMPWPVFLVLAALSVAVGCFRLRSDRQTAQPDKNDGTAGTRRAAEALPDDRDLRSFAIVHDLELLLSATFLQDSRHDAFVRAMRHTRNLIVTRYALTVPNIDVGVAADQIDDEFTLCVREVPVMRSRFHPDKLLVRINQAAIAAAGIQADPDAEAEAWQEACWVAPDDANRLGIPAEHRRTAVQHFARCCELVIFRNARRFIGIQEAQAVSAWIESVLPDASRELQKAMPVPKLAEVLRRLLGERIGIRNVKQLVETLVEWAPRERDSTLLAEYVRIGLGSEICQEFSSAGILYAILLAPEVEELMRSSVRQTAQGHFLAMEQEDSRYLLDQLNRHLGALPPGHPMPVLLTTQDLRRFVRNLVEDELFDLHVLSFSELTPRQRVHPVAHLLAAQA